MRERVVQFGPAQSLVGIETVAFEGTENAERPTWIFLNAGIVHRVGPHRLTVVLARRMARAGFPALRFDLSGLGDSPPRSTGTFEETAVEDVREAMDHSQHKTGANRFVLCGLCSGADNSLRAGVVDSRVVGLALLDPYVYHTMGFYLRRLARQLGSVSSWQTLARLMSGALKDLLQRRSADSACVAREGAQPTYIRPVPAPDVFAADLRTILDRGAHILAIYSGLEDYIYAGQFNAAFRWYGLAGRVSTEFLPEADHTHTEMAQQRRLCDVLLTWAESCFPVVYTSPARQSRSAG